MKIYRGAIIVALLLALTLAMNSTAKADPIVTVLEWQTPFHTEGQYQIFIDSLDDWKIVWFAVENIWADEAWTKRDSWEADVKDWGDDDCTFGFCWYVDQILGFGLPGGTEVVQVVFYEGFGNPILQGQKDANFFWVADELDSQFWAGLINVTGEKTIIRGDTGELNPVPEPVTLFLFGTGLVGLGAIRRKRANKA